MQDLYHSQYDPGVDVQFFSVMVRRDLSELVYMPSSYLEGQGI